MKPSDMASRMTRRDAMKAAGKALAGNGPGGPAPYLTWRSFQFGADVLPADLGRSLRPRRETSSNS